MSEIIDIRCPLGPKALLMRLRLSGEPSHVTEDNLLELSCKSCKSIIRKQGKPVNRVLHLYDFMGNLVFTRVE